MHFGDEKIVRGQILPSTISSGEPPGIGGFTFVEVLAVASRVSEGVSCKRWRFIGLPSSSDLAGSAVSTSREG
jgi:hypothetical protein